MERLLDPMLQPCILCLKSMFFLISCDLYTFGDISHLFDVGI